MATGARRARIRALAKLNLSLEVLNKRPDGYHNLRTLFQTISLSDTLEIEYKPGRGRHISIESDLDIPNNLVVRAAEAIAEATNVHGKIRFRLKKVIPMGSGMGGGSSDAAAVLLALPALTGRSLSLSELMELGAQLGSDVPFFLVGGTALGLGRGTELYPLTDAVAKRVLVVVSDVHVSTAEAYSALGRTLTSAEASPKINISQSLALALDGDLCAEGSAGFCRNDFESVVFQRHPKLSGIKNKLKRMGARPALMTGSGAALFGVFRSAEDARRASDSFQGEKVFSTSFVSRSTYRRLWWRQLAEHIEQKAWPPLSRYAR